MQNDDPQGRKNANDSNGLGHCPMGGDVGVFGKNRDFFDSMCAGFIYAAAIRGLIEQTLEIDRMLETIDEEEKEKLLPTLQEDLDDINAKWLLATAMFLIEA
jgi:glutamate synthase domain-containing protein 3